MNGLVEEPHDVHVVRRDQEVMPLISVHLVKIVQSGIDVIDIVSDVGLKACSILGILGFKPV